MVPLLKSNALMARVMRASSLILVGYAGSQALRLASNLILTRLLFPEAFGLMALISVVTVGLTMFSDVGIAPSIAQSKRGDDPAFLNTAWSIQVIRSFILWGAACALALPISRFYDEPLLAYYLPIAALSLLIAGFNPTRIETAHRHLVMGRVTLLQLAGQFIGTLIMVLLAWWWQSVAALVVGGVIQTAVTLLLMQIGLPGHRNRFQWDRSAAHELMTFGKWIFLSTLAWFVASQGDKAILGKFLSLEDLGIYNIGFFLASFPVMLGHAVSGRILIPAYRENPGGASAAGDHKLRMIRYGLTVTVTLMLLVMALCGPGLVELLYDSRYLQSGAIVTLLSLSLLPQTIGKTYDQAALAAGDSRRFFIYSASRAVLQVIFMLLGIRYFGLAGAIVGLGLTAVLLHPVLIWVARVHKVWDPLHDLILCLLILSGVGLTLSLHWDTLAMLL